MAFDSAGNLAINDQYNRRIRKIDTSGNLSTIAGNGQFKFDGDNGSAYRGASLDSLRQDVRDQMPRGISLSSIPIADWYAKSTPPARSPTVAGNLQHLGSPADGGPATSAMLGRASPYGAVDSSGNFYLSDRENNRIRKVDTTSGNISTVAGGGAGGDGSLATAAGLSVPRGIVFDAAGNLYISDKGNNKIRKVNTAGIISTIAGNGTASFSGDGGTRRPAPP